MPHSITPVTCPDKQKSSRWLLKQFCACLLWLALFTLSALAQTPTIQPENWRADLRFLADELPRRHPNLFFNLPVAEFERAVAELDAAIPTLPDHVIITRLVALVARVGDAHTSIDWASTTGFRRYPLLLQVLKDQRGNEGLYVTAIAAETERDNRGALGYVRALGARVVRIDGTDVESAGLTVAALVSAENLQWVRARIPTFITTPEFLHALGLIANMERCRFTFETAEGQQFELEFKPLARTAPINWLTAPFLTRAPIPLYRSRPASLFYWYEYLEPTRTLYFQYNRCQEMATLPLATFTQELLNFIDTHTVDKLVVDLRQNPGGNSGLLLPFINAIRARAQLNRAGKIYVGIDRGTISSGMFNAFDWQQRTSASLIGEPTGGKPNAYGEVKDFFLPNSNLHVVHSTRFFQLVPGDPPSLFPSVQVELLIEDYLAGRDPVLERALQP